MTARAWYAANARQLLEDRRRGMVPAAPVSVVLTGQTEAAPAVYVHDDMPLDRLDWRMLVNLQVWLWADTGVPLDRLLRVADAIARARPALLVLRFEAAGLVHDVEIGAGHHRAAIAGVPAAHEFLWTPINLSRTECAAQLRRALVARHPCWTEL